VTKVIIETIGRQFGASLQMLENAINLCPDHFWATEKQFWYISYHCLFWLDYYLTIDPEKFEPPLPFTLSEFDPEGAMPDRTYSKEELISYLNQSRVKCNHLVSTMTEEMVSSRWKNKTKDYTILEILIYNLRHVQHHAAQLNLLLRQEINDAPNWVSVAQVEPK